MGVNLSLDVHEVQPTIYGQNLETNTRKAFALNMPKHQQLRLNRSTEITFSAFETTESGKDADGEANQTVIAAYLHDKPGKLVARAVNWPEPLKWAHMPKPRAITINVDGTGQNWRVGRVRLSWRQMYVLRGYNWNFEKAMVLYLRIIA